jgi:hypothetical protein
MLRKFKRQPFYSFLRTKTLSAVNLLGSFRKAWSWGRKKPDIAEVSSQLRILVKQLERQRNKLEKEERDTKARAIKARKAGQTEAYRTYATEMIRFRRYVLSIDKSRLQMLKVLAHLTRAQTTAKAAKAMEDVAEILGLLGGTMDASKVIENADEIARKVQEFEIESSIADDAFDSAMPEITGDDIAEAMAEIEAEVGGESPVSKRPATEAEALEEDIKSLERELGV